MADNVGYTPGSGAVVAADDVGGVLYQRIKPAFGTDNTAVDVSATNPLPVVDTQLADVELLLTRMLNALNAPQGYDKSLQRQRGTNIIESGTITTVGTVSTITAGTLTTVQNLSTIDTLQGRIQVYGANLSAWADTVRARIT
jgi:hypothetical protein